MENKVKAKQAAEFIGVSGVYLSILSKRGVFSKVKEGRNTFYDQKELDDYQSWKANRKYKTEKVPNFSSKVVVEAE